MGVNTLGVVSTDEGSEIMLEDNEEGAGSNITTLEHAGSLTTVGNHQVGTVNTTAGSRIVGHGQRMAGAAAQVAEAAPVEEEPVEAAPEEEDLPELSSIGAIRNCSPEDGISSHCIQKMQDL